jgi:soluble lytic murein transglycosylase
VEAGVPVDEYQRGVVDYFAAAYQPGIEAFQRYIAANPETYRKDSHLYLAWSYEALGDAAAALAQLDAFAAFDPARALFERAEMQARANDPAAVATYATFAETYPDDERAAASAWASASLAEKQGDGTAAERYVTMADAFPFAEQAPEALARAAWLNSVAGNSDVAVALYQRLAEQYPANEYGSEALIWLIRAAETGDRPDLDLDALREQSAALPPAHYFAIRARDVANGRPAFSATGPFQLPSPEQVAREKLEAETWLLAQLEADPASLPAPGELAALSPELAGDARRLVGETLWRLGRLED